MYNVSDEFNTAIKSTTRQITGTVKIGTTTYSDEVVSAKINAQSTAGEIIGQALCQTSDIEMLMSAEQYAGFDVTDEVIINLCVGEQNIQQGKFLITEQKYNSDIGTLTLKCVDYMAELDKYTIDDLDITLPCTADDYLTEICSVAGVVKNSTAYWNSTATITEANFSGTESLRVALKGLCQMCLANAYFNNQGKLTIKCLVDSTAQSITADDYFTADFGEKVVAINTVVLDRQPQQDIIYAEDSEMVESDGKSALTITNNPFMDDNRTVFANSLLTKIKGFSLTPCELDWRGNFAFEPFEKISVETVDETTKTSFIFGRSMTFNGGYGEKISCKATNEKPVSYANGSTLQQRVKNAEIKVDKATNEITALVENCYTKDQVDAEIESKLEIAEESINLSVDEKTALKSSVYTEAPTTYQKNDVFMVDKQYIGADQTHDIGTQLIATSSQVEETKQYIIFGDGSRMVFADDTIPFMANIDFDKWDKKDKYQTDVDVSASINVASDAIINECRNGGLSASTKFSANSGLEIFNGDLTIWDKPESDSDKKKVFGIDNDTGETSFAGALTDFAGNATAKIGTYVNDSGYTGHGMALYKNENMFAFLSENNDGFELIHESNGWGTFTSNENGLWAQRNFSDNDYGYLNVSETSTSVRRNFSDNDYGYLNVNETSTSVRRNFSDNDYGYLNVNETSTDVRRNFSDNDYGYLKIEEANIELSGKFSGGFNRINLQEDSFRISLSSHTGGGYPLWITHEYFNSRCPKAYFRDLYTNNIKVTSDRRKKTDIKEQNFYALDSIRGTNFYSYNLDENQQQLGMMTDEVPECIATRDDKGDEHIDIYASVSLALKSIQELTKKVERQTNRIDDMQSIIDTQAKEIQKLKILSRRK